MKFFKRKLAEAIEWRFRERMEAERQSTMEMGRTYVDSAAALTDQIRALEVRVSELEKSLKTRES